MKPLILKPVPFFSSPLALRVGEKGNEQHNWTKAIGDTVLKESFINPYYPWLDYDINKKRNEKDV